MWGQTLSADVLFGELAIMINQKTCDGGSGALLHMLSRKNRVESSD